jgi:hypothetical protein
MCSFSQSGTEPVLVNGSIAWAVGKVSFLSVVESSYHERA